MNCISMVLAKQDLWRPSLLDGSVQHDICSNGEYKFIIPNGQGPFKWKQTPAGAPDSTTIVVNGNQEFTYMK